MNRFVTGIEFEKLLKENWHMANIIEYQINIKVLVMVNEICS